MEKEISRYDEKLDEKLKEVKKKKEIYDRRREIVEIRRQMSPVKKPTTTKLVMGFIFLNCTAIEIYSMAVMYIYADLDPLYALITAVVGEAVSFAVYCAKAYNETKQEELIRLERDKLELDSPDQDNDDSGDPESTEPLG